MTIHVQISNKEQEGGRHLRVRQVEIDKITGRRTNGPWEDIAPGLSRSFHVHLLRDIELSEQHPEHKP